MDRAPWPSAHCSRAVRHASPTAFLLRVSCSLSKPLPTKSSTPPTDLDRRDHGDASGAALAEASCTDGGCGLMDHVTYCYYVINRGNSPTVCGALIPHYLIGTLSKPPAQEPCAPTNPRAPDPPLSHPSYRNGRQGPWAATLDGLCLPSSAWATVLRRVLSDHGATLRCPQLSPYRGVVRFGPKGTRPRSLGMEGVQSSVAGVIEPSLRFLTLQGSGQWLNSGVENSHQLFGRQAGAMVRFRDT